MEVTASFLYGDLKIMLSFMGHGGARCFCPCLFCEVPLDVPSGRKKEASRPIIRKETKLMVENAAKFELEKQRARERCSEIPAKNYASVSE